MKIQQSRNQREGHYGGRYKGRDARTFWVLGMPGASASKREKYIAECRARGLALYSSFDEARTASPDPLN